MDRLKELEREKQELLKYREFLCSLSKDNSLYEKEEALGYVKDKPKVKKIGVR